MSDATAAAECCRAALWAVGLCAWGAGSILALMLPRDREGVGAGLAAGFAFGVLLAAAWHVGAACRMW